MDTVPAPITKMPSLTKPPSVKVLKPSSTISLKGTRKPRTTRFKAKHTKMMEKRNEQLLEKYKVRIGYYKIHYLPLKIKDQYLLQIMFLFYMSPTYNTNIICYKYKVRIGYY